MALFSQDPPDWLAGELEELAKSRPETGEEIVKQVYQWRHDTSKAWALALLGAAFAFIGTAAISALKDELQASNVATMFLLLAGGLAVLSGAAVLASLRLLLLEYMVAVQLYMFFRAGQP